MFGFISQKFRSLFSKFSSKRFLTKEMVEEAIQEIKTTLLEADVSYAVVEKILQQLKEKSVGEENLKGISAADQLLYRLHESLVEIMGVEEARCEVRGNLTVIMLCGLQGAGKTTTVAKLALFLKKENKYRKILLAPCDLQRPAAIEQLKVLGQQVGVDVFSSEGVGSALTAAKRAHLMAKEQKYDVLIVDTAGRLHLDEALMQELVGIKNALLPREVLFVANAAIGQDAIRSALEFDEKVGMTGTILTMLDGTARAGAAISIREITKKPLKFEGIGEKPQDFQVFCPRSMADRLLDRGDVINLVKKAKEHISDEENARVGQKLKKGTLTYGDYLQQMKAIQGMGSISQLMKMMPGMSDFEVPEGELTRMEALIFSMTPREREELDEMSVSRRRRVALGSGMTLDDVNRFVKGFQRAKQLFKKMPALAKAMPAMQGMKQQLKGMKWR